MSEIKNKLLDDIKKAMKSREQELLTTLRGISAAIKQIEIDKRIELDDEQVISVINTEIKKRRDTLSFAKEAKRDDLIASNEKELKVLQSYVGEELSEDKLRDVISNLVTSGAGSIGEVMGALNKDYKGRFEGKLASSIVKEVLS